MTPPEKTVFISYRRAPSKYLAGHLYDHLTRHGYDVFYDTRSLGSGGFSAEILRQIAARMHFIVLLAPESLKRCTDPDDLLRREIEYAIDTGRNIIPFVTDGFDFYSDETRRYLTGKLAALSGYQALNAPYDYMAQAFERLREQYLSSPSRSVSLTPAPAQDQAFVQQVVSQAEAFKNFIPQFLSAEQYFNRAYSRPPTDYAGQIGDYTAAIQLNPQYADAYNNRGFAFYNLGELDSALADYDAALWLNPQLAIAYLNRGNVHTRKGNWIQAIADYSSAIQYNPSDDGGYYMRAWARFSAGDASGAIADYNAALQRNPQNPNSYNDRGWVSASTGDLDGAIQDYSEAIRLNSQFALAYHNRAAALLNLGRHNESLQDYDAAIQLTLNNPNLYVGRSWARFNLGDFDGTIADCTYALSLNTQLPIAHTNRGSAYLSKGDIDSAIADYRQAYQLDPMYADPFLGLGNCFFQMGRLTDALREYKRYVQLSSNPNVEILMRIAQLAPLERHL